MTITIDALYFLLLVEGALVFFVLTLVLLSKNGKYKKLLQRSLKESEQARPDDRTGQTERVMMDTGIPAVQETVEHTGVAGEGEPLAVESLDELPPAGAAAAEGAEGGEVSPGTVRRLQRMVNYQKNAILDLMCYKDIFESAQKKLTALHDSANDLRSKIQGLIETEGEKGELVETMGVLDNNSSELEKFISVIERENENLSEKFRVWETEFKSISEDLGDGASCAGADDDIDEGRYNEILKEKEALVQMAREVEEKLQEKSTVLSEMQKQYEDLEKEYMILYRQQQQQQKG
ncbi:MAG: hypothetical protein AB1553_15330 [Nitrospirota bacterium]